MDQAQQLRNVIKGKNSNSGNTKTARVITVTSGKGGVGKSNMCVNLAVCLRKAGKKVIIFDADFGLANVEVMFGAMPKYNLSDLVYRDKKIEDILSKGPEGIEFISAGSGILSLNNLSRNQITYIRKDYYYRCRQCKGKYSRSNQRASARLPIYWRSPNGRYTVFRV